MKKNKSLSFNWDLVEYWNPWADKGACAAIETTLKYMIERRFGHQYDELYNVETEYIQRSPSWADVPDYNTEIYFDSSVPDDVVDFVYEEFKNHIVEHFSNRIKFVW